MIGFGIPGTQNFARFHVLTNSAGVYPDWNPGLRVVEDAIVGSDNFEIQILGFGSARVTLHLDFESREQFRAFQAHWGKRETLVLYDGFTRHEGDVHHWQGRDYESFHNTLLIDVSNVRHMVGGSVECNATFMRSASGMGVSTT